MVHTDQRSRFRQSVSLDHGVAQASPELFSIPIQRGAARNESPEFPAEPAMDMPEPPPPAQKVFALGPAETLPKVIQSPFFFQISFHFMLQRLQYSRHADQH